jgi:dynein heavy chain, axonemal
MKSYLDLSVLRINELINRVRTDLTLETRVKIITIITIDVHARDVIEKFVREKIQDI